MHIIWTKIYVLFYGMFLLNLVLNQPQFYIDFLHEQCYLHMNKEYLTGCKVS